MTTELTAKQFKKDWEEVKEEFQEADVYWDSPDEIIAKMVERGYSITEDESETIEMEA